MFCCLHRCVADFRGCCIFFASLSLSLSLSLPSLQLSMSSPTFTLDTSEHQLWCNTFRKAIELCSHAFPSTPMMDRDSSLPGTGATPNPDKLYRLFQQILKVHNKEHQILFKECHVRRKILYADVCLLTEA